MNALAIRPAGALGLPHAVVRERWCIERRSVTSNGRVSRARYETRRRRRNRGRQADGAVTDSRAALRCRNSEPCLLGAGDNLRRR